MPQSFFIDPDGKVLQTTTGITGKKDLEDGAKALANLLQKKRAAGSLRHRDATTDLQPRLLRV